MFTPPVHGFAGSSPLTRGKQDAGRPQFRNEGFIPTHAGRTSSFSWLLRRSADHPRSREENFLGLIAILIIVSHPHSRGENLNLVMIDEAWAGSSPLTRGKQNAAGRVGRNGRLIPAHAGKTCPGRNRAAPFPAHPRSRGENVGGDRRRRRGVGSSPLTRGKRWR